MWFPSRHAAVAADVVAGLATAVRVATGHQLVCISALYLTEFFYQMPQRLQAYPGGAPFFPDDM